MFSKKKKKLKYNEGSQVAPIYLHLKCKKSP